MSENFNLNMQPILTWLSGHMDRHFSMRFDDSAPVVVLILQDEQWRCERRVALVRLSDSKVSELNLAVEKMLQSWAARGL